MKPGFHTTRMIEFQIPKDSISDLREFYLVVESFLEDKSVFKETALRFECDSFDGKSSIEFVGSDTKTQGSYKNQYGSNGYEIITKESSLSGNIKLNWLQPGGILTWADQTKDPRALPYFVNAHDGEVRVAACRYGEILEFQINTGKSPQQLALYFLDWEKQGTHAVEIEMTAGDKVDKQVVENFKDGIYQIYKIQGRINVRLKSRKKDAVISGIFFD